MHPAPNNFYSMKTGKSVAHLLVLVLGMQCATGANAQNLIPNPSFEEHTQCPGYPDPVYYPVELAPPWTTPTRSSDYFHSCGFPWNRVPSNRFGYEYAKTGDAYAGFHPYSGGWLSTDGEYLSSREYLEAPLLTPLQADSAYLLTIHVSLPDSCAFTSDAFEVVFTNYFLQAPPHPIYYMWSLAIYRPVDLTNKPGNFLTRTDGWMELKWVYRARGGESFMTMGIFRPEPEIQIQYTGIGTVWYYLYVDDVSLVPAPAQAAELMPDGDLVVCDSSGVFTLSLLSPHHSNFCWSTGDTTRTITVTQPGIYTVWAEYEGGYLFHDTIEVAYRPMPVLDLGPDTLLCPGDFPLTLTAPAGMDSYLWSTGDTASAIIVQEPGIYYVHTTHYCGEQADTIAIGLHGLPVPDLGRDTTICGEAPIAIPLSAPQQSATTYLWNTGSTDPAIVADAPGLWWVRATHACGVFSDSIAILRQPILSSSLPPDTTFCVENGLYLSLPPGMDTYEWSTGQTGAGITVYEPGTYYATGTYACGSLSDTIVVNAAPELSLDLPERLEVRLGDVVHLDPGLAGRDVRWVQWQPAAGVDCPSCPAVTILPPATALYTLEVEDGFGCRAVESVYVAVDKRIRIFVPDAFSPNDDGINDRLVLYAGAEVAQALVFRVFDRWGGLIFEQRNFESNDESAGWNGTTRGKPAPAGVYIWQAEVRLINGATLRVQGEVNLLR